MQSPGDQNEDRSGGFEQVIGSDELVQTGTTSSTRID
jgi:hypothetical protein